MCTNKLKYGEIMGKNKKLRKILAFGLSIVLIMSLLGGCKSEKTSLEKVRDLDCTVVPEPDIPAELATTIADRVINPFQVSYIDGEYLYLVVGYGEQTTGGYSITVEDLYITSNAIYLDTNLIGPSKDEQVTEVKSYPYIVVKTENIDLPVVYD